MTYSKFKRIRVQGNSQLASTSSSVTRSLDDGVTLQTCVTLSNTTVEVPNIVLSTVQLVMDPLSEKVTVVDTSVPVEVTVPITPKVSMAVIRPSSLPIMVGDSLLERVRDTLGYILESVTSNTQVSIMINQVRQSFWEDFGIEVPGIPEEVPLIPFDVNAYEDALRRGYHLELGTAPIDPVATAIIELAVTGGVAGMNFIVKAGTRSSSLTKLAIEASTKTSVKTTIAKSGSATKEEVLESAANLANGTFVDVTSMLSPSELAQIAKGKNGAVAVGRAQHTSVTVRY